MCRSPARAGVGRVNRTLGERGSCSPIPQATSTYPFPGHGRGLLGAGCIHWKSPCFLAEGAPEKDAVARANVYAALSTTRVGTQKSFLRRVDFEAAWAQVTR